MVPIPAQVQQTYTGALFYIVTQLNAAWKQLRKIKKEAFHCRQEFLCAEQIKKHDDAGHPNKAKEVKKMLAKEVKRQTFWKLRWAYKESQGAGLSKVICTDKDGQG